MTETGPIDLLLVEDDPLDARLVREMLKDGAPPGFTVTHLQRLDDALAYIADHGSDVILLDLTLPDGQGLHSLTRLHMAAPHVPIVVMSADADETLAITSVREGAQNYLVKGRVNSDHLVRALRFAIERQRTEDRLRQLAYHDALTGLPNRALFQDRVGQALAQARRHNTSVALLFLDLDGFKAINDTLGHEAGDELLREVGRRLQACTREEDTVARLAGDEFTVVLPAISTRDAAAAVAQKIIDMLSTGVVLGGHAVSIIASIGISVYPDDGDNSVPLLSRADAAMYTTKHHGKSAYAFAQAGQGVGRH